jgi:hypothetical protein
MPPQQCIRRDDGFEFEQGLSSHRLGLARQKSPLSVGEPDSPATQSLLEQSILGLQELNDDQLMAMNLARHHQ